MKEVLVCFSVVFLCSGFLMASDVFTLNCAESLIVGKYGSSVILPCWLTPEINAETLEIRWYRPEKFQAPFQFYQSGKFITDYQGTYKNRSSLSPRNPQSTGLKQGDVSLRLDNLGMSDIGIFHCYVSGDKSYQDKSVNLSFTALGSPVRLSLQHLQDSVNLSCSSCGWFPQPRLLWRSPNEKGDALSNTQSPIYRQQENGLFCAYGWVVLSSSFSKSISCSVTLSEDEKRDVSFDLDARPSDDASGLWKILFGLLLFCLLAALIGVGLYKMYSARKKHGYMPVKMKVLVDLTQGKVSATHWSDLREDEKVTITLDTENCNKDYVRFNSAGDMVRDTSEAVEKYAGHGFPYELCVHGSETLQPRRTYWVVELKQTNAPTKKSWLIGVARFPCTIIDNKSDFTQSDGFWFLYSDPEKGVCVNSDPEVTLVVKTPPERIGVLLDSDKCQLAFYNLTKGVSLLTMLNNVKGKLVPLFNPGIGDRSPLKIINPQVQTQNQPTESGGAQASNANQYEYIEPKSN